MESTQDYPVAFFEYFILSEGLESSKSAYIESITSEIRDHNIKSVDNEKGIIIAIVS